MSEALCQCGHEARHHSRGKCNTNACCGNEKCDDTFTPPPTREPIKCPNCGVARGWDKDGHLTRGIWTLNCVRCGAFTIEIDEPSPPTREPIRLTDEEYDAMPWPYGKDEKDWTPEIIEWAESILAARLAGGPTLADAWDEGFDKGAHYASADLSHATYRTPPPPNPYRTPESEDTE